MIRSNREMIKRLRDRARVRTHWVRIAPEAEYAAVPSLPVVFAGDGQYTMTADQNYASGTYAVDLSGIQWLVTIGTDLKSESVLRIDVIQRTVYLNDSFMEPLIELDLRGDTSVLEEDKTVKAKMEYFKLSGQLTDFKILVRNEKKTLEIEVPYTLNLSGETKDELIVDQVSKNVLIKRRVGSESVEDITETETGHALSLISSCFPNSIIEVECTEGHTETIEAQVKELGRGRIYNCMILNAGDFLVDSEGEVLEWR